MNLPMLGQLVGAYFHPDWADDADEDTTVRRFLAEAPGSASIVAEIDWVLATMPTEDEVRTFLLELGSCYTPAAGEGGHRRWLQSIADRAAEDLPALRQLMAAYLHQDYELFGPSPLAAAETFLRGEPLLGRALPGEVEAVLSTHSESEVATLLSTLGCQIPPWAHDGTYTTCLRELAAAASRVGDG